MKKETSNVNKTQAVNYKPMLATVDYIRTEANKNPDKKSEGYLLQCGKQLAYSDVWLRLKRIIDESNKTPIGYINWKILNLIIGFAVGGLFMWYALNGC